MEWAEILKQPTKVAKIASKNWLFHGVRIKKEIAEGEADWSSDDFYGAGQMNAAVLLDLVPLDTKAEAPILELLLQ